MTTWVETSRQRYRFDDITLDVGQHRAWRATGSIPLSKLTFKLLRVLVEAAPNLVTHDELVAQVWGPRRVVTPTNLSQRIKVLRQALGERAEQPRYIEAVRGQGYRLIPAVEILAAEPPLSDADERAVSAAGYAPSAAPPPPAGGVASGGDGERFGPLRRAVGIGVALVAALAVWTYFAVVTPERDAPTMAEAGPKPPTKILVLPFENQSGVTDQRYFVDGLTDELIGRLQRLPELRVMGRTTGVRTPRHAADDSGDRRRSRRGVRDRGQRRMGR